MPTRGGRTALLIVALVAALDMVPAQRPPQPLRHMFHAMWDASDGVGPLGSGLMARSGDGYLWLPSRSGLLRFDGVRFRTIDSLEAPALRSTKPGVYQPLFVGRDGDLWASRPDGALLRYGDGRFTVVLDPDRSRGSSIHGVEDGSGRTWITTHRGLFLLRNGRLERSGITPAALDTNVSNVIADSGGGVWVGAIGAVWHVGSQGVERFAIPDPVPLQYVRPRRQLSDGTLWADGPDLMTLRNGVWKKHRYLGQSINAIAVAESPDHHALIATRGSGLLRALDTHVESLGPQQGLSNAVLKDVLVDSEGSIWITTEAGLDQLRAVPFTTLGRRDGAPFDSPLGVASDAAGGIWIDTWGEGRLFHFDGGRLAPRVDSLHWSTPTQLTATEKIQLLGTSRQGGVWAIGLRGRDRVAFRRVRASGASPLAPTILPRSSNIVAEDRTGSVWISLAPHGFRRLHDGQLDSIALPVQGPEPYVQWVAVDSLNNVWASNNDTMALYRFTDGRLAATLDSSTGLTQHVERIVAAGGDTLWLVLRGGSLGRLIGDSLRVLALPDATEMLRASAITIVATGKSLWIASPLGIVRVDMAALHAYADGRAPPPTLRPFGREDGLPVPRITGNNNRHGATQTRDGRVWFSTPAGVAMYDAEADVPNRIAPHPVIEEITVSGRRVPYDSALTVPPSPGRLEIHFSAPSLRIPERVRIEYRLDGADEDWVPANTLRLASYSQLRSGLYRFRVRAWNEDGVPSAREATLAIRVLPRWFESTWFVVLGLSVLVAGGPLIANARARRRAAAREHDLQSRFDATLAERARLSRELHDTLLQGFTGITLKLQAVHATMVSAPDAAANALSRVLDESDVALLDARQMIWDMRLTELEDRDLGDAIEESGRQMIGDAPIAFDVTVDGPRRRLPPQVESVLYRIGREALANALKHAHASRIAVALTYVAREVHLRIRDDGIGIPEGTVEHATQHGHLGVLGMHERAARAGGTLRVESASGDGTTIVLSVPIPPDDTARS